MERDTAGVLAPPPILYASALVAALGLDRLLPWHLPAAWRTGGLAAGGALVAVGVASSVAVVSAFGQQQTAVSPRRATTALVTTGPYRYSRNPDYVGQAAVLLGLSLLLDLVWGIALLPAVIVLVDLAVVRREERYMARRFGAAYREYTRRVGRWF